jgi:hypothetical protein
MSGKSPLRRDSLPPEVEKREKVKWGIKNEVG